MAEDLVKETQHVVENEIIREKLPSLSDLKREVLNYYDSEFESTPILVQNKEPLVQAEIEPRTFQPICSGLTDKENSQKLMNCNKIILGSRPNTVSKDEDDFEKSAKAHLLKDVYFANGSKLNGVSIDENYFEELVTSYEPSVVLQDIHSYLRKSKRFCDTCYILFPEPNGFNGHMQIFHPEECFAAISPKQSDLNERRQHKCTVCAKLFVAKHVLRRHLINIHKLPDPQVAPNTSNVIDAQEIEDTTKDSTATAIEDTREEIIEPVVENTIKETNSKASELIKDITTRETENVTRNIIIQNINAENLPSNSSNTCFHCKKTFHTQKSLIEHLYDVLQMKRKNTEIVPVFKSVLFKCNKCDINFTTSQFAANHAEHMEMLINWKCNICNRIFKKEDELSHERQHSVSNNFLVYNLGDIDVTNILFRCSKCATHFTESNFLYHFRDCGLEVTKSVICNVCNISLDYNLKTLHEFDKHTESKLFTIIQCDVISDNPVNTMVNKTQTKEKLKEVLKRFREVKIVLQRIDSKKLNKTRSNVLTDNNASVKSWRTKLSSIRKREKTYRKYRDNYKIKLDILKVLDTKVSANIETPSLLKKRNLSYSYCETCKCFITTFRKAVHVLGRCKNLAKFAETCKYCGLVLTSASIVTHRRLHEENGDLKLKNFRFFNIRNGRFMNPPIPEYPKCAHCAVHFLTKSARIFHSCSELAYQTCHLCGMKLSEPAFKLHMAFHQYTTDRVMTVTSKNSQTLEVEERLTDDNATKTTDKDDELIPNMHNVSESNSITTPMNPSRQYKLDYTIVPDTSPAIKQKNDTNTADYLLPKRRNLIYSYCDTCKCFITKFKKTIHLEGRCKNLAEISDTCKHCGLILTRTSIDTHKRLHEDYKHLKLKNFRFFDLHSNRFMNPPIPEYPKCAHCAVRFLTKTARDNHICSKEAYQKCHICEINFSKAALERHMRFHRYETDRTTRTTMKCSQSAISLDIPATMENGNNIAEENTELHTPFEVAETRPTTKREGMKLRRKCEINSHTKLAAMQLGNKKRREHISYLAQRKRNYIYSYCETCKCFITKFRKAVHIQGRCKNMPQFVGICKYCGLILTRNSFSTHINLHVEKKNLTLKNFRFINLYNGRPVNPPIPEYPKCSDCEVHFLTKTAMNSHRCSENLYQTCQLCEMKLSETAFKLHMGFHQYATNRVKKVTSNNSPSKSKLELEREVNNDIDLVQNSTDVSETKQTTITEYMNTSLKHDETRKLQDVNKKCNQLVQKRRRLIYSYCKICKCFITKFKKTVHLQGRCKNSAEIAETCKHCGLIFTKASIMTHRRLHEEYKDLNLKDFKFVNIRNGRSMNPPIPEYPKCAYCSVHFLTKTAKNNHTCSEEQIQTCHLCEITFSKAAFTRHMMFHQYATDRKKSVTSMNFLSAIMLDVEKAVNNNNATIVTEDEIDLVQNSFDVAETRPTTIRGHDPSLNYTIDDEMELNAMRVVNKEISLNIVNQLMVKRRNLTYYYCEICKCFITRYRKDFHIQERCKNLTDVADTCEHCGLIVCTTSIVTHRRLHEQDRDLNLKNFKFLDLHNGQPVNPPIPEYPKCANCEVHFLTKTAMYDHICFEEVHETCRICHLKFSRRVFKCHVAFHQYPTDRIQIIEKRTASENVTDNTENEIELTDNPVDMAETSEQISSDMYEIIYTCRNCSVSFDTYDKVVEHCQGHYEKEDKEILTEYCNYCELTIDTTCFTEHANLHEKGKQFKLLKFDSYYLPAENHMWVKHIFNTLPGKRVSDILRNSVYRFECRIKMEVIQQGNPNLTVYKCDQCSCFIDPGSLFKHSENSCFKLRRHPCAVCGILYNSSASRNDHEKIHDRPGITMDSYRIVIFNREHDKQVNRSFCLRRNYVLFQCRKCGMIIDKLQNDIHQCEVDNVKKCPQCGLLLHTTDFDKHINKHKDFVSFTYSNMKVILLGEENSLKVQSANTMKPDFKGAIYDYKMFVCSKCEICIKNEKCMANHICQFGRQRLKCFKCDLYFSAGRIKTHTRCHEQDPDFVRSNMYIISFDSCTLDLNKNTTIIPNRDCELSDSNSDSEILATDDTSVDAVAETVEMTSESVEAEIVKVYKCICGLHFLNDDSIKRHFGVCRSKARISEQKCPKCGLLFTPNILFTHLLAHHSNKSRRYKYDILELDHTQMNINTICNGTVIPQNTVHDNC